MFNKNAIIYLTKSKVWACQEDKISRFVDLVWNEENLIKVIGQIKKKLKTDEFKIILGGDISYAFTLKEKAELTREDILAKAKEITPEKIDNESFDWQEVGRYDNNEELIQICGISKNVLNILSLACEKNKINVEFMLPCAILLSWQSRKVDFPSLILWSGQENLAVITQAGIVYDCQVLGDNVESEVKKLIINAKKKFGFDLKSLILDIKKWEGVSQIFPGWQENHFELDPFCEMNKHNQTKGEDDRILELNTRGEMDNQKIKEEEIKINRYDEGEEEEDRSQLSEVSNQEENINQKGEKMGEVSSSKYQVVSIQEEGGKEEKEPSYEETGHSSSETENLEFIGEEGEKEKASKKWKIIMFGVIGVVVLLGLGIGGFFIFGNKAEKNKESNQIIEATPIPTPTPINLSIYKIQILNGSGIEGHAGVIKEALEKVEFSNIETDNADAFNYKETEINYKKGVPEELLTIINNALSNYETTSSAKVKEDEDYDVIIIAGSKKKIEDEEKTVEKKLMEESKEATESGEEE